MHSGLAYAKSFAKPIVAGGARFVRFGERVDFGQETFLQPCQIRVFPDFAGYPDSFELTNWFAFLIAHATPFIEGGRNCAWPLTALRARKEGVLPGPRPKPQTKRKVIVSEVTSNCNSERTVKSVRSSVHHTPFSSVNKQNFSPIYSPKPSLHQNP